MRAYVEAPAYLQARYILGREGVGYNHGILFGEDPRDRDAEQEWFDRQREQAATGSIRVPIPGSSSRWKGQGEARGRGV